MKVIYPIIISKNENGLIVSIPDCEIDTHGTDLINAVEMARDAISIWCIAEQDMGKTLPKPSSVHDILHKTDEIVTLVDVDIEEYRRKLDLRVIRKNLTLPSWLNERAEKANINFSQTLQKALKQELQITD